MELTEYRQITGSIGVALFVAGMAIWPAGVTAKPWNWALWGVGVGFAFLGIYVFTAAVSPSTKVPLPGKSAALDRVQTAARVQVLLAGMRLWGKWLSQQPSSHTPATFMSWMKDVIAFLSEAYGVKHMALFSASPDADSEEIWRDAIQTFDEFIVRSDQLTIQPGFVFDQERWKRYASRPEGAG